jgi:hypothetical protein
MLADAAEAHFFWTLLLNPSWLDRSILFKLVKDSVVDTGQDDHERKTWSQKFVTWYAYSN